MNVLSLFDGMSCGQIALNRAGIKYSNYFASEVDKHAIKVTQANYPDTIQLGCVKNVKADDLPKIDLLIGGSPCQGFSFAGKQLNFEDERSKLFFEYVRLLNECKPKYFLLENVKMKKEYQDIISSYLGVEPIHINSALVSAQNRVRLYWTNIPNVAQPSDKGICLSDILDDGSNNIAAMRGRYLVDGKRQYHKQKTSGLTTQRYEHRIDNKSTVQKDNIVVKKVSEINNGGQGNRIYSVNGKGICLSSQSGGAAGNGNMLIGNEYEYRKLTPIECERLQTVPDNYANHVSASQRYKMLGNGWTVDVIAHILGNIN